MTATVEFKAVTKRFGPITAIADISFSEIGRASCRERVFLSV